MSIIVTKIVNPYENVSFENQQKANFHTHTSLETINGVDYGSDGSITQAGVIDNYHSKGYKILAITDHDYFSSQSTTHPWEAFGRNPTELGMLAIEGREFSYGYHRNSLFCDLAVFSEDVDASINAIKEQGGLCIINHPGRNPELPQYYADLYLKYKTMLVGLEVYNQGDRYPNDRKLWDKINAITIPQGRIVYGYSGDDMHLASHLYRNYNFVLSPTNSEIDVRQAMENGHTYFCYESGGSGNALAPKISNIDVNEDDNTITITADSGTVKWITENTMEVDTGNTFDYSGFDKSFVRAVITNAYGITYTQPFVFTSERIEEFEGVLVYHNSLWEVPEPFMYFNKWVTTLLELKQYL